MNDERHVLKTSGVFCVHNNVSHLPSEEALERVGQLSHAPCAENLKVLLIGLTLK